MFTEGNNGPESERNRYEEIAKDLANKLFINQASQLTSDRDILGLKEHRTLSQILESQFLDNTSNTFFNLAALSLAMMRRNRHIISLNLQKDTELTSEDAAAQKLTDIDLKDLEFQMIIYGSELAIAGLTRSALEATLHRIDEQQSAFLENPSTTTADLQLSDVCHYLTLIELPNPILGKPDSSDVKKARQNYRSQKTQIPLENFLRVVSFPNELRAAVNLRPLKYRPL